ncbi:hypothetical protein ACSBLW_01490 [Thioclava sp. FR2]
MKAMYLAFAATLVLAVGADYALDHIGFSAAERSISRDNVRLD